MNAWERCFVRLSLVLLPIIVAGCTTADRGHDPQLVARWDTILNRFEGTGATVTARVVDVSSGRELYAKDIDIPYTPASNMKIPISAAGLDMFGLDHTFDTYLAIDGDDLWVIGTGDPGIGDPRLAKRRGRTTTSVLDDWSNALLARGIRRIGGDLYYWDGALDSQWLNLSWGDDVLHWYGAPTSGLNLNDNCVDITIRPTEVGQPAAYDVMPPVQSITVINECVTGTEHAPTIEKLRGGDIFKLGGTCARSEELKSKPVESPGAFFADAFRTHLASRGIVIGGSIVRAKAPLGGTVPPSADKVVAIHKTTVRDIIGRINTNSQNFFAEAFSKLTGQAYAAKQGRSVPGSWIDGEMAIRTFLRRNGVDDRHFVMADGSGLSDENRLTSRLLTDLFAAMFSRPDGEVFVDSLAKGGINGTLEKRFAGLDGHVFAKTGYIEGVRALSGYVRTYDNRWLSFSIIYNHIPGDVKPYEALQDEAVRELVRWPRWWELK